MGTCYFIFLIIPCALGSMMGYPDSYLVNPLTIRDLEDIPGPLAWGHKYIGGGAGEGDQFLSPGGEYPNPHQVKTDAALPAYCEPPNPCPIGFSSHDGCHEQFENTAEFSRDYQAEQKCLCDEEHMFQCPHKEIEDQLEQLIQNAQINMHKTVAKKFAPEKRGVPRKKRDAADAADAKNYDWLKGESLPHRAKKWGMK